MRRGYHPSLDILFRSFMHRYFVLLCCSVLVGGGAATCLMACGIVIVM